MFKIICDSCTDMTEAIRNDPHFVKVPLSLHIGGETLTDDDTLDQAELLRKMAASSNACKTSCPSPAQYLQHFERDKDNYVVTLSAALSGSYNAAMQARAIYREEGGGNVHVFNSRSASAGQTQIAILLRELAGRRLSFQQVVEQAEAYIRSMNTLFVLDNLDNLRKNGRLTRLQSIITGALRVKLLLGSTDEGEIKKLGQGLSIRQSLSKLVSRMAEDPLHIGRRLVIAHCNCLDRAEYVLDLARQKCRFGEMLIVPTGGVSTVYADLGGVVAAY